jgi:hypothetical protein
VPTTGIVLDPLAPGEPEQQLEIQQPDASLVPFFLESSGWFGSGFFEPRVTVGADRVIVLSQNAVHFFDTRSLAALGSFSTWTPGWSARNVAFYRGEVYVLGLINDSATANQTSASKLKVFDVSGQLRREYVLRSPHRLTTASYTGLDVAWGEVWVATPSLQAGVGDITGQEVAVFDARTGAFKGAGRQPLGDRDADEPRRHWWDFAISPELDGGISDRRFFGRGASPLVGFGTDNATGCTGRIVFGCVANNQRGTDAVWGMRWFLELNSTVISDLDRHVTEYSIEPRKVATVPAAGLSVHYPGHYLLHRRTWAPRQHTLGQALSLTDLVYSHRKARIDWEGPLTKSDWLRGTHSLPYVVSDADIFVLGARGERWYEPARGFQKIELWIDGQLKQTKTTATGSFDNIDTTQYANRPEGIQPAHTIELRAYLEGDRILTTTNDDFRIDNLPPTGTVVGAAPYARETVTITGTATDSHSGPASWQLQAQPSGGDWQDVCPPATQPDAVATYSCNWKTTNGQYPDGTYRLRARLLDGSSDGGNIGYSPEVTTIVDNTAPILEEPAPAVGSEYQEEVVEDDSDLLFFQSDATSGVEQTDLEYNAAADGSDSGAWRPMNTSPVPPHEDTEDGEVELVWHTGEIPDGLYQVRARMRDRAGNVSQTRWQVVVSAKRRRRKCPLSEDTRRCYAGLEFGWRALGVHAEMTAPEWEPGGKGFSWFALAYGGGGGGNTNVQVGFDHDQCKPSQWWALAEWTKLNGDFATNCLSRASGTRTRFMALVQPDSGGVQVHVEDNQGRNRARVIAGRTSFRIARRGRNIHVFGETNRYGRRIGGTAREIRGRRRRSGNWEQPWPPYYSLNTPGYTFDTLGSRDAICMRGPGDKPC